MTEKPNQKQDGAPNQKAPPPAVVMPSDNLPPAPPRAASPDDVPDVPEAEVKAAEAKLERLQRANKLKLLNAEIEKLENGGLSPQQIARKQRSEAIREKTHKEKRADGTMVACYREPEKSYIDGKLHEPGYIVRLPLDALPAPEWEPVSMVKAGPKTDYLPVPLEG